MSVTCERVARLILPVYRSFVAKELVAKYQLTQNEAATKLGTTQAAISQYINSKRGVKGMPNYEEIEPLVRQAASKLAERMAKSEMTSLEFGESFCELCNALRIAKKV